ncbi:MAG: DEAD/DEAH box helicase, partial [Nitrospiraceae bacterium]
TARMQAVGRATSFVTRDDQDQIRAIEKLLGAPVPRAAGSAAPARPHPSSGDRPRPPAHAGRRFGRPDRSGR